MKAISTVIAAILLLMIVITLAGTAYVFMSGFLTGKISKTIQVTTFSGNLIILQNAGTESISIDNDIKVLVNGNEVTKLTTGSIEPQSSGTIKFIPPSFDESLTSASVQIISPSNTVSFKTDILPHAFKVTADTVGLWHLDEGSGNDVYDETDNNNDGAILDGEGDEWVAGRFGTALNFDGSNDYVAIPDSPNLRPDYITVEAWVKPSEHKNQGIVAKGYTYNIYYDSANGARVEFFTPGGTASCYNGLLSLTGWSHVAITFDGSVGIIYVNGQLGCIADIPNGVLDYTRYDGMGPVRIARYSGFFNGVIDEVRISNKALSQEEIIDGIYG